MQRTYLKCGDTLELNNRTYTVISKIGDGATCAVYSAEYEDSRGNPVKVNIKECYPYNANVCREGFVLNWESEDEKEKYLESFEEAYQKLNIWQKDEANISVYDICKANNTEYIIMEHNRSAVTFDKDKYDNLASILRTVKLLAFYVGKYHQKGYLHLDIKPSNFLVYPRPSEHVVLFDLDTVTAISDIESGNYKYFSYSDGWAAPEQKQGKVHKICPATDIFAIGAVLFEKVMGRQIDTDDVGCFAEWTFEGNLFENVNPKIKRLLANIFKKTLAASVKRRYQNVNSLIIDLDMAIKVAESAVYLESDDICCSGYFVGREEELKKIKDSFDSKKKAVFLHGFSGIGKTEIARKYAEIYKKDYDVILFVKYDNNSTLQDKLDEIDIVGFEGEIVEKRKKLRSLIDNKTLVIVDNFDVEIGADNGLKFLFETKANVLVSTRTDFSSIYSGDKYAQIEIKELASDELEQVFLSNAKIEIIKEDEKDILSKIFKLIQNHTYATELLAKQMYYSGWSFETLYNRVKLGFASLSGVEKIVTNKDEDILKDNSLNILRAVFRVTDLTDGQKQVLKNMALLSFVKMTKDSYKLFSYCENLNDFNYLFEVGYIQSEQDYYLLHTLTKKIVELDLGIDWDSCIEIYNYIAKEIEEYDQFRVTVGKAHFIQAVQTGDFIDRFVRSCDISLSENYLLCKIWLGNLILCEKDIVLRYAKLESKLIDILLNVAIEKDDYDFKGCLLGIKIIVDLYTFSGKKVETDRYINEFLEFVEFNPHNIYFEEIATHILFKAMHSNVPKYLLTAFYKVSPRSFNSLPWQKKERYGLELNEQDILNKRNCEDLIIRNESRTLEWDLSFASCDKPQYRKYSEPDDWYDSDEGKSFMGVEDEDFVEDEWVDQYAYYGCSEEYDDAYDFEEDYTDEDDYEKGSFYSIYESCEDAVEFYDEYLNHDKDKALEEIGYFNGSDFDKVKMLINLIYMLLDKFDYENYCKSHLYHDWKEIEALITLVERRYKYIETYDVSQEEKTSVEDYIYMLKCVLYLQKDMYKEFLEDIIKIRSTTRNRYSDDIHFTPQFMYIIKMSSLLNKNLWLVIPTFQAIKSIWPDRESEDFNCEIAAYYLLFEKFEEISFKAFEEVDDNNELKDYCAKAVEWCKNWMDIITNKKFDLIEDDFN